MIERLAAAQKLLPELPLAAAALADEQLQRFQQQGGWMVGFEPSVLG